MFTRMKISTRVIARICSSLLAFTFVFGGCGKKPEQTLSGILVDKQWRAATHGLPNFEFTFMRNSQFIGFVEAGYMSPAQQINGTWQVIENQLFLDYVYSTYVNTRTKQVFSAPTHIWIQFTQLSGNKLLGVDTHATAWELQRIE